MKRIISVFMLVCMLVSLGTISAFAGNTATVRTPDEFEDALRNGSYDTIIIEGEDSYTVFNVNHTVTIRFDSTVTKVEYADGYEANDFITLIDINGGFAPIDDDGEQSKLRLGAAKSGDRGTWGGIDWTLSADGTLTIKPTAGTPVADPNCGKTFEVGALREAVRYDSKGKGKAIEGWPYDRSKVKKLIIEEGVTSIGSFALQGMTNLSGEVVIPSTVTYIGQEAFQNTSISKLSFALGGTEELCIAPGAFKSLAITELVLPYDRSEVHLHCWAFVGCGNLENVVLPANITTFSDWTHVDYYGKNNNNGYDSQVFSECKSLKNLTFASEEVKNKFFAAPNNQKNIKDIGDVEIVIDPDAGKPPKAAPVVSVVKNPYSVPATADNSNIPLWALLFAGFAAVALMTGKKKA